MLDRGDGAFRIGLGLVADRGQFRDSGPILSRASMLRVDARELCGVP